MVTPLGCGVETTWSRLLNGESGAKRIEHVRRLRHRPARSPASIPRGDGTNGTYNPDQWMEPKEQRKVDDFIVFAMCAAKQALDDAGWHPKTHEDQCATGVMIGSGIGGIEGIADMAVTLHEKGPRRVSPFFIPGRIINLASGFVSIELGLKGPNHAVVTACSTGAHAIGDAARMIALGDADVMVAGGAESPVNRMAMAGFCRAAARCRPISTTTPKRASRPYDKARDGFVMGEGAGVVVLEELEHAKARGAKIYAELIGYGLSGDAYHITAPSPDGDGAFRCMSMAIKRAGITAGRYRLHQCPWHLDAARRRDRTGRGSASGRQRGRANYRCRRPNPASAICSAPQAPWRRFSRSWPSATGLFRRPSISITRRWIPPIDLVPHKAHVSAPSTIVLSNSFGFGGDQRFADLPPRHAE